MFIVQTWSVFIQVSYICLKLAKSYYVYAINRCITFKLSKLKVGFKLKKFLQIINSQVKLYRNLNMLKKCFYSYQI